MCGFPCPVPANWLYPQARPAFQGKQKERRVEPISARTPTLFASHIRLCSARIFGPLDWILSFPFAVTRTAIRTSFPIHISPFGGLGAAPPKGQPISAVIVTSVAHKVPACYTVRRTPQGIRKSGCQIQRFQRSLRCTIPKTTFLPLGAHLVFEPKWHWLCFKYRDLSHISAFWLSRTFQGPMNIVKTVFQMKL